MLLHHLDAGGGLLDEDVGGGVGAVRLLDGDGVGLLGGVRLLDGDGDLGEESPDEDGAIDEL